MKLDCTCTTQLVTYLILCPYKHDYMFNLSHRYYDVLEIRSIVVFELD